MGLLSAVFLKCKVNVQGVPIVVCYASWKTSRRDGKESVRVGRPISCLLRNSVSQLGKS